MDSHLRWKSRLWRKGKLDLVAMVLMASFLLASFGIVLLPSVTRGSTTLLTSPRATDDPGVIFGDDFNDDIVGEPPVGWTSNHDPTINLFFQVAGDDDDRYLFVGDNRGGMLKSYIYATVNFDTSITSGRLEFDVWMHSAPSGSNVQESYVMLATSEGSRVALIQFTNAKLNQTFTISVTGTPGTSRFAENTIYHVCLGFDGPTRTLDLVVNGMPELTEIPYYQYDPIEVRQLKIETGAASTGGECFFDNFLVMAGPFANHPADFSYQMDEFDQTVTWEVSGVTSDASWQARRDGIVVGSGTFTDDVGQQCVSAPCTPQDPGTYTYTLHVDPGNTGFLLLDSVQVTVVLGDLTDRFTQRWVMTTEDAACQIADITTYWSLQNVASWMYESSFGALDNGYYSVVTGSGNWFSLWRELSPAIAYGHGQFEYDLAKNFFHAIRGKTLVFDFMFRGSQSSTRAQAIIGYRCGGGPMQFIGGEFMSCRTDMAWEIVKVSALIPATATSLNLSIRVENDGAPATGCVDNVRLSLLRRTTGPVHVTAASTEYHGVDYDDYVIEAGSRIGSGAMTVQVEDIQYISGSQASKAYFSVGLASWGYNMPSYDGPIPGYYPNSPWSQTGPDVTRLTVELIDYPGVNSELMELRIRRCAQTNDQGRTIDPAADQDAVDEQNMWLLNALGWAIGVGAGLVTAGAAPAVGIGVGLVANMVWDAAKAVYIEKALADATEVYNPVAASPSDDPVFVEWNAPIGIDTPLYFKDLATACNFELTLPDEGQYTLKISADLGYGIPNPFTYQEQYGPTHTEYWWRQIGSSQIIDYITFQVGSSDVPSTPPSVPDTVDFSYTDATGVTYGPGWYIHDAVGIGDAARFEVRKNGVVVSSGPFNHDLQLVQLAPSYRKELGTDVFELYVDDGYTGLRLLDTIRLTVYDDDTVAPSMTYSHRVYYWIGWFTQVWFYISDASGISEAWVHWKTGATTQIVYDAPNKMWVGTLYWADAYPDYAYAYDNDQDRGSGDRGYCFIYC